MAELNEHGWLIRPPKPAEAPAVRMLLPRRTPGTRPSQYLLALEPATSSIVGAASYQLTQDGLAGLRLQIIGPRRRQRAGTALVESVRRLADAAGAAQLEGEIWPLSEPGAAEFAQALGFARAHRLTTMRAPVEYLRGPLADLRQRLITSHRIPAAARLVMLPDAPADDIARLFTQWISLGGAGGVSPEAVAREASPLSPVVMVDGEVAGFLLWQAHGETAIVVAWVIPPRWSNSWVNVLLLARALDIGWDAGARMIEYDILDGNHQPAKLAQRAAASIHRITDTYRLCW